MGKVESKAYYEAHFQARSRTSRHSSTKEKRLRQKLIGGSVAFRDKVHKSTTLASITSKQKLQRSSLPSSLDKLGEMERKTNRDSDPQVKGDLDSECHWFEFLREHIEANEDSDSVNDTDNESDYKQKYLSMDALKNKSTKDDSKNNKDNDNKTDRKRQITENTDKTDNRSIKTEKDRKTDHQKMERQERKKPEAPDTKNNTTDRQREQREQTDAKINKIDNTNNKTETMNDQIDQEVMDRHMKTESLINLHKFLCQQRLKDSCNLLAFRNPQMDFVDSHDLMQELFGDDDSFDPDDFGMEEDTYIQLVDADFEQFPDQLDDEDFDDEIPDSYAIAMKHCSALEMLQIISPKQILMSIDSQAIPPGREDNRLHTCTLRLQNPEDCVVNIVESPKPQRSNRTQQLKILSSSEQDALNAETETYLAASDINAITDTTKTFNDKCNQLDQGLDLRTEKDKSNNGRAETKQRITHFQKNPKATEANPALKNLKPTSPPVMRSSLHVNLGPPPKPNANQPLDLSVKKPIYKTVTRPEVEARPASVDPPLSPRPQNATPHSWRNTSPSSLQSTSPSSLQSTSPRSPQTPRRTQSDNKRRDLHRKGSSSTSPHSRNPQSTGNDGRRCGPQCTCHLSSNVQSSSLPDTSPLRTNHHSPASRSLSPPNRYLHCDCHQSSSLQSMMHHKTSCLQSTRFQSAYPSSTPGTPNMSQRIIGDGSPKVPSRSSRNQHSAPFRGPDSPNLPRCTCDHESDTSPSHHREMHGDHAVYSYVRASYSAQDINTRKKINIEVNNKHRCHGDCSRMTPTQSPLTPRRHLQTNQAVMNCRPVDMRLGQHDVKSNEALTDRELVVGMNADPFFLNTNQSFKVRSPTSKKSNHFILTSEQAEALIKSKEAALKEYKVVKKVNRAAMEKMNTLQSSQNKSHVTPPCVKHKMKNTAAAAKVQTAQPLPTASPWQPGEQEGLVAPPPLPPRPTIPESYKTRPLPPLPGQQDARDRTQSIPARSPVPKQKVVNIPRSSSSVSLASKSSTEQNCESYIIHKGNISPIVLKDLQSQGLKLYQVLNMEL